MILEILLWLVFIILSYQVLYLAILGIAGLFSRKAYSPSPHPQRRYLILIPSYKEDSIILQTAEKTKAVNYPSELVEVTVIADKLQPSTVNQLRNNIGVNVIEVAFEKSTKARSIKSAMLENDRLGKQFDAILILDADNFIEPDCLTQLNASFDQGFIAVQLHRIAKNKNTPIAFLDAISEEINNHLFRKGMRNLGLSSALIGSGMAFDYTYFKNIYLTTSIENNPGEDKELEERLLRDGYICDYLPYSYILDEKVQSLEVLENQRVRWISTQLGAIKQHFIIDRKQLFSTNFNYTVKAFQHLIIPRVFLLLLINGLTAVHILISLFFNWPISGPQWYFWLLLAVLYNLTLLISIPRYFWGTGLLKAIAYFPLSAFAMIKALTRSKHNQRDFIHTQKNFKN